MIHFLFVTVYVFVVMFFIFSCLLKLARSVDRHEQQLQEIELALRAEPVQCDEFGCTTTVVSGPEHTCSGCGDTYCDDHIRYVSTWYGEEPAYICHNCLRCDAEPTQY